MTLGTRLLSTADEIRLDLCKKQPHIKYPENYKPKFHRETLASGNGLIRFENLYDLYFYDNPANLPEVLLSTGYKNIGNTPRSYFRERGEITADKKLILEKARKQLNADKDFLKIIHEGKSAKRKYSLDKFSGNLSIVEYAKQSDKIFNKQVQGKKSKTLNIAFQVGTFADECYETSFIKILKLILSCQALNISLNIDVFDSDTMAFGGGWGYTIVNVAKSSCKLNLTNIFAFSHPEFFHYTLFNSYLALGRDSRIESFIYESQIIEDLSDRYDIISGNMVNKELSEDSTVQRIIKIANL
jgi:hypothetical protein